MRILFVWPKAFELTQTFPLAFAQLASLTDRKIHQVRLLDCNLEDIDAGSSRFNRELISFNPDFVGFSCWAFGASEVIRGVRASKKACPSAITAVGGVHMTMCPDVFRQVPEIDFIFRGDATKAWPRFLSEIGSGHKDWSQVGGLGWRKSDGSVVLNTLEHTENLDEIPPPDYEFAGLRRYHGIGYGFLTSAKRSVAIFATRGCPFTCEYCCAHEHYGTKHRHFSIQYLVALIKDLYDQFKIDFVNFMDDNLTEDLDWAKDLCRALAGLNLPIAYRAGRGFRMDRTDLELFQLMKKAGFDSVTLPIESGSDDVLCRMGKQITTAPVIETARLARQAGLRVYAFVMYGYPDETVENINQSFRLLRAVKPDYFLLFRFNPLPGTIIYNKLVARGEIPEIGLNSIPYNFTRGLAEYTPPGLKDYNFRAALFREYLHMFITRPRTIYHYFDRNRPISTVKVLIGNYIYN